MIILEKEKCTGCATCFSICHAKAIRMEPDAEGFLHPVVDDDICTHCQACKKICPVLNLPAVESEEIHAYAAWNKDECVRKKSSSGGIFSLLAEAVLDKKGYVCGAGFDENNVLRHMIISQKNELSQLRGSKYLQSQIGSVFSKIKKLLWEDNYVLFSGVPCQVAGLKSFLRKNFDKLYTVEVLCSNVNSPLVFDRYLEELVGSKDKITEINFRKKAYNWRDFSFSLNWMNKKELCCFEELGKDNIYMKGFLGKLYMRQACSGCIFAKHERYADFTLGDFWGVWDMMPELYDERGVSVVLTNNRKANNFWKELREGMGVCQEIDIQTAYNSNSVFSQPHYAHKNRNLFFELLNKKERNFMQLTKDLLGISKVGILTFHYNYNYGANLQAYALMKSIETLGYSVEIIDYVPSEFRLDYDRNTSFASFRNLFLKRTKSINTEEDWESVNAQFDRFIVGSDQIWRSWDSQEILMFTKYFLSFVFGKKSLISYAPSFGVDTFVADLGTINLVKLLLKRFDAVSVREESGIQVLKNVFDINAEWVLDPTLLLNVNEYEKIIESEDSIPNVDDYIACSFLGDKEQVILDCQGVVSLTAVKNSALDVIDINREEAAHNSVANWLREIKNSKLVITNSFHCMVFAIIFQKDFFCLARDFGGNSRCLNLLSKLGISNRFFDSIEELDKMMCASPPIEYSIVNSCLIFEREKSMTFLKRSLELPLTEKRRVYSERLSIEKLELNTVRNANLLNTLQASLDTLQTSLDNKQGELNSLVQSVKLLSDTLMTNINCLENELCDIKLINEKLENSLKNVDENIKESNERFEYWLNSVDFSVNKLKEKRFSNRMKKLFERLKIKK